MIAADTKGLKRLAFMKRDLRSPAWKHADAYNHPPLAKFLFGAGACLLLALMD